jgi:hypothetical protein
MHHMPLLQVRHVPGSAGCSGHTSICKTTTDAVFSLEAECCQGIIIMIACGQRGLPRLLSTCCFVALCRQKTIDSKTWCNGCGDGTGIWCGNCLFIRIGENLNEVGTKQQRAQLQTYWLSLCHVGLCSTCKGTDKAQLPGSGHESWAAGNAAHCTLGMLLVSAQQLVSM